MLWRVDVFTKPGLADPYSEHARALLKEASGVSIRVLSIAHVYLLEGELGAASVEKIAAELLIDKALQTYKVRPASDVEPLSANKKIAVLVFRKPGVMDPVEASAKKAIRDLGFDVENIRVGMRYTVDASLSLERLREVFIDALANELIEDVSIGDCAFEKISVGVPYCFQRIEVPFLDLSAQELSKLNAERDLSLNLGELQAIQRYFRTLKRNPTDVELETLAQTWSEHCKHKTLRGTIAYNGKRIDGLLQNTIMKATVELNKPWCLSVFKDNAGVIEFNDDWAVCFKVETHNHPSAIEPYGGANTGLGGVIRDVLGCGLGAKPIANTDVFCVAPPDMPRENVPKGVVHPKRLLKAVVSGVRDYGNRMGIPTVNGAVFFDERYLGNPLVYCGTIGLLPKSKIEKGAQAGEAIVLVGGRTGRDGIHGATFSSATLHEKSEEVSSGAVQIGNAITEKKLQDALLQAREKGLYTCVTDCGAGGLSSAVGEMGEKLGAEVDLEKVPLKYEGLSYAEIWISEAQERMVLSVSPEKLEELLAVFKAEDVEAMPIGRFLPTGQLVLRYEGVVVGELEMEFLHHGLPRTEKKAVWKAPALREPRIPEKKSYGEDLKRLLCSWNISSKEWIVRQYDHEVQGRTVLKPLQGATNDGPGDAAVIRPLFDDWKGLAIANGTNPHLSDLDPYHMVASAIDEAVRNVVSVGGDPLRTALLDNFSWGNPDRPEILGALVRAAQACYDIARAYGTPFISGKDSLNNEFICNGKVIAVPPTLLISAISFVPDIRKCVTMDIKEAGNLLYIVGLTKAELGGSHFYGLHGELGMRVPRVDVKLAPRISQAVHQVIQEGLVCACHDCSEGGLVVCAAEMAFAGNIGAELDLTSVPIDREVQRDYEALFSESNSRFLVEVRPQDRKRFEQTMKDIPSGLLGKTTSEKVLRVQNCNGVLLIDEKLSVLKEAWQSHLKEF